MAFLKRPGTKRDVYYLCEGDPTVSAGVNVSASRLILRLKIIRGPTAVTTREESWGAYLRGVFDVGYEPPIFYSPRSFTVPCVSPVNSTAIEPPSLRPFYLISIHGEKHMTRTRLFMNISSHFRCSIKETDGTGRLNNFCRMLLYFSNYFFLLTFRRKLVVQSYQTNHSSSFFCHLKYSFYRCNSDRVRGVKNCQLLRFSNE